MHTTKGTRFVDPKCVGPIGCLLALLLVAGSGCKRKNTAIVEPRTEVSPAGAPARNPPPPAEGPTATATLSPAPTPRLDLDKIAKTAAPAVVRLSVFDASGQLLRKGTGFFISDNGRLATTAHLVAGAENAIATLANGKIYNVTGILAASSSLDLAILKADAKKVSFLPLNRSLETVPGAMVAIVPAASEQKAAVPLEASILENRSRVSGDWLELSSGIAKENAGGPVVTENGDVIGVITLARGAAEPPVVVRVAATQSPLLSSFAPDEPGRWPGSANVAKLESPSPTATPTPKPKPVKLAGPASGQSRLVYTPQPAYPAGARLSRPAMTGSGQFRVNFGADGVATSVQIVQSTGSGVLDSAATSALRRWRSTPGQEWSANVPITFGR